jgi:hypothetical protein
MDTLPIKQQVPFIFYTPSSVKCKKEKQKKRWKSFEILLQTYAPLRWDRIRIPQTIKKIKAGGIKPFCFLLYSFYFPIYTCPCEYRAPKQSKTPCYPNIERPTNGEREGRTRRVSC